MNYKTITIECLGVNGLIVADTKLGPLWTLLKQVPVNSQFSPYLLTLKFSYVILYTGLGDTFCETTF